MHFWNSRCSGSKHAVSNHLFHSHSQRLSTTQCHLTVLFAFLSQKSGGQPTLSRTFTSTSAFRDLLKIMCKIHLVWHVCRHWTYRVYSRCGGTIRRHNGKVACQGTTQLPCLKSAVACGRCLFLAFHEQWEGKSDDVEWRLRQSRETLAKIEESDASNDLIVEHAITVEQFQSELDSIQTEWEMEAWTLRQRFPPEPPERLKPLRARLRCVSGSPLRRELLPEDIDEPLEAENGWLTPASNSSVTLSNATLSGDMDGGGHAFDFDQWMETGQQRPKTLCLFSKGLKALNRNVRQHRTP